MEPAPVPCAGDEAPRVSAPRALTCEQYALFCDEYELTMAQSFWKHRQNQRCVFEATVRRLPQARNYLVVAGLEQVLAMLTRLHFDDAAIAYLRGTGTYSDGFLEHLTQLRFSGDVHAMPEGTVAGADTPLVRVTAPRIEATLVESALLAIVNHQTAIASKTARIVQAARGRPVWDFSLRRVHGPEAALGVARAAYIAGAAGTATTVAGERLGIPTTGTMAHHYLLAFGADREQQAFEQFLRDYPDRAVLLIDTFDTVTGARNAVAASQQAAVPLHGVRIDSGDLVQLARDVRRVLDDAGMRDATIIASGDLDDHRIDAMLRAGAPVDAFGVGTMLGTSYDAPALGGIFKLVAQEQNGAMVPVMKQSSAKVTDPGAHQVFRTAGWDTVALDDEVLEGVPLLAPVMRSGRAQPAPSLVEIRDRCAHERAAIPEAQRRLDAHAPWPVRHSPQLRALRRQMGATEDEAS